MDLATIVQLVMFVVAMAGLYLGFLEDTF